MTQNPTTRPEPECSSSIGGLSSISADGFVGDHGMAEKSPDSMKASRFAKVSIDLVKRRMGCEIWAVGG